MNHMFESCKSLRNIPLFDTSNVIDASYMFVSCHSLEAVPALNFSIINDISGIVKNCYSLREFHASPMFMGSDNTSTAFTNCPTLSRVSTQDINQSITFSSSCLGPAALNEIYTNLATVTGKIITVTSNWGTASDNPAIATAKGWTVTG